MSDENATTDGNSNIMAQIRADFVRRGSKPPAKADMDKLLSAYQKALDLVTKAEAALTTAKEAEYHATRAIAEAVGGQNVRIGGVVHSFACRGSKVFFRRKSKGTVLDL